MISVSETKTVSELPFIDRKAIWEITAIEQMIKTRSASGGLFVVYTVYQGNLTKEDFIKVLTKIAVEVRRNGFVIGKLSEREEFMTFLIKWEDVCLEIE